MKDGKHLILCIDDDPDILYSLKIILESNQYLTMQASSAEEGIKRCRTEVPDLIIVDLMMEEIDAGTNFVKELAALGIQVPIYMLSSMGDNLTFNTDYAALGLTGVLQKPVVPEMLLTILKAQLYPFTE